MDPLEEVYEAFGERKSLFEWSRDRRSIVSHLTLAARMDANWELESALTIPPIKNIRQMEKVLVAFGVSKTIQDWGADPRAKVPCRTILWRTRRGWSPELAITQEPPQVPTVRTGARRTPTQYAAFGDTNTLRGWLEDPRCKVKREKLLRSLAQGLSMEEALTTGGEDGRRKRGRPIVEKPLESLEEALEILKGGAELCKYAQRRRPAPAHLCSKETLGTSVASEIVTGLVDCGYVELVFDTPTISEYRVSEFGKRAPQ